MAPVVKEVSHFKSTVVMSTSMNDMGTCGGLESGFPENFIAVWTAKSGV